MNKRLLKKILIAAVVVIPLMAGLLLIAALFISGTDAIEEQGPWLIDRIRENGREAPELKDAGRSLILGNPLRICMYAEPEGGTYSQQYMKRNGGVLLFRYEVDDESGTYEAAENSENAEIRRGLESTEDGYLYFEIDDIRPKAFRQPLWGRFWLKTADGEIIYSEVKQCDVEHYCLNKIAKAEENPEDEHLQKLKRLCEAILEYGDASKEIADEQDVA